MPENDIKIKTVKILSLIITAILAFFAIIAIYQWYYQPFLKSIIFTSWVVIALSTIVIIYNQKHSLFFGLLIMIFSILSFLVTGFYSFYNDIYSVIYFGIIMILGVIIGMLTIITYENKN